MARFHSMETDFFKLASLVLGSGIWLANDCFGWRWKFPEHHPNSKASVRHQGPGRSMKRKRVIGHRRVGVFSSFVIDSKDSFENF